MSVPGKFLNDHNIIKKVFDEANNALRTTGGGGPSGGATEAKQDDQIAILNELNDKTAAALVTEPYDYIEMTYVGASTDIDTVTYKLGGSGGTTVATLTMGYDGNNRLQTVTKS